MHLSIQYRTQLIYGYIRPSSIFVTNNRQRHNELKSRLRLSSPVIFINIVYYKIINAEQHYNA